MPSITMLPSGRFRAFAQVRSMREQQVFDKRSDAETWAKKTEERMRKGKWTKAEAAPAIERRLTVTAAFEAYKLSEDWLAKEEGTTRKVELNKQKPVIAALGSRLLTELTVDDVRDYIAKRRNTKPMRSKDPAAKLSGDQVRLEVAALSSMCNYAVERKWIAINPCIGAKRPRGGRRTTRVTDDLMGAILQHDAILLDPVAYVFFRILFTTVCRPGELATARKEWLRDDPPQIAIPKTKNEDARSIILPVHLHQMVKEHLEQQHADCPYLFGTRKLKGDGWSPYAYATPWRKVADDLGLREQNVVPYLARHEGISRLFERTNLSDGQIAGLSGHRSPQALWHYKHLRNEHQRPIVNALDAMVVGAMQQAMGGEVNTKLKPGEMLEPIADTMDESQAEIIDLSDDE